jgi:hypothetical protein
MYNRLWLLYLVLYYLGYVFNYVVLDKVLFPHAPPGS